MIIGVPKEVKNHEDRVGLTPSGVFELVGRGHSVLVQEGAGLGAAIPDAEYVAAGATIVNVEAAWAAEMVVKVKEPVASEYHFLRSDLLLFTYLHIAADEPLTRALADSGVTAVAYETVFSSSLDDRLEIIAHHYARSDDLAKALDYLDRAAGRAAALGAGQSAEELWRRGLKVAEKLGDKEGAERIRARLATLDSPKRGQADGSAP